MADNLTIDHPQPEEFPEFLKVLSVCFNSQRPDYPDFDGMLPDLYSAAPADLANCFVLRDGGRIVSHVGLFPIVLNLCGRTVEIGGLGGVCTLPEYRGGNLMQRLLDHVHEVMRERGYPFGWLAGDRRRYSTWGYENACPSYRFYFHKRGLKCREYADLDVGELIEGTVDELNWDALWTQAQANPTLTACGEEKLRKKYGRFRHRIVMTAGESGAHIVAVEHPGSRVITAIGGNPQTAGAIIAKKVSSEWEDAEALLPAFPNPYWAVLKDVMQWCNLIHSGSLAVLDLAATLKIFLPHFNRRVTNLGLRGEVKILMGPSRQTPEQVVILEADGRELRISPGAGRSINGRGLEMTCLEVSEFLFSSLSQCWAYRLEPKAAWLAALMPVPLNMPLIYHV